MRYITQLLTSCAITTFALFPSVSMAQTIPDLFGWVDSNGLIRVQSLHADGPVSLPGLTVRSASGYLTAATPGDFLVVREDPSTVTYSSFGGITIENGRPLAQFRATEALIDGTDPCDDLTLEYGGKRHSLCGLPGDLNFDNQVNFDDFLQFSGNFGKRDAIPREGDFDLDGTVGFGDFLMMSSRFGERLAIQALDGQPARVRVSQPEEVAYAADDFQGNYSPQSDYFVARDSLWKLGNALPASDSLNTLDEITIALTDVDYSRGNFFVSVEQDENAISISTVRLRSSIQSLELRIPEDLFKTFVYPIGQLDAGVYEINSQVYELTVTRGYDGGFDADAFFADPNELPNGLLFASVAEASQFFEVSTSGASLESVPEPATTGLFAFALGLALAWSRGSRRQKETAAS